MLGRSYCPMLAMLRLPYTGYAHAILCWCFILAYSDSNRGVICKCKQRLSTSKYKSSNTNHQGLGGSGAPSGALPFPLGSRVGKPRTLRLSPSNMLSAVLSAWPMRVVTLQFMLSLTMVIATGPRYAAHEPLQVIANKVRSIKC